MKEKLKYPNIAQFNPNQCISRKLLKCNRIVSAVFRKYFLPYGVSNSQVSLLFVVAKKQVVTQNELVDILYLEKSTVSRNLQRLFQNGYLKKITSKQLSMTEEGKELLEAIIPEWEKAMKEIRMQLKGQGEEALNLVLTNLVKLKGAEKK